MKQVNFVIFDMDGLLLDTERIFFRAFQRAAKKLGYNFSFDTYLKVVGVTDEIGKQILSEIYGENSNILHAFYHYQEEFHNIVKEEGITVKPGAQKLLNVLDKKGIKRCIASSSPMKIIKKNLELTGLHEQFDFYVSGTEVKKGKPYPDIFLKALERANVSSEFALVLEDSCHGLQAAVSANIRCILIPDLIQPTKKMKYQAYRICTDLGEVADLLLKE